MRDRSNRFSCRLGDELCGLHVQLVQDRFDVEQKQPCASVKFDAGPNVPGLILGRGGSQMQPWLRS